MSKTYARRSAIAVAVAAAVIGGAVVTRSFQSSAPKQALPEIAAAQRGATPAVVEQSPGATPGAIEHERETHYMWFGFTDGRRETGAPGQPCPNRIWRDDPATWLGRIEDRVRAYREALIEARGHDRIDIVIFADTLCGRRDGYVARETCTCAPTPSHVRGFIAMICRLDEEFGAATVRVIPYIGPYQSVHWPPLGEDRLVEWGTDGEDRRAIDAELRPFHDAGVLAGVALDSTSGYPQNFAMADRYIGETYGVPAIAEAFFVGPLHPAIRPGETRYYRLLNEGDTSREALMIAWGILDRFERARENGRGNGWLLPDDAARHYALLHSRPEWRDTDHPTGTAEHRALLRRLGFTLVPMRDSDAIAVASELAPAHN